MRNTRRWNDELRARSPAKWAAVFVLGMIVAGVVTFLVQTGAVALLLHFVAPIG